MYVAMIPKEGLDSAWQVAKPLLQRAIEQTHDRYSIGNIEDDIRAQKANLRSGLSAQASLAGSVSGRREAGRVDRYRRRTALALCQEPTGGSPRDGGAVWLDSIAREARLEIDVCNA
jgi:hypothetical protein